jgi:hypothetical protein
MRVSEGRPEDMASTDAIDAHIEAERTDDDADAGPADALGSTS